MKIGAGRGPLKAPSDTGFAPGALVTYENEGSLLLGGVLGFRAQKYRVLNEKGKEVELPAVRLHALPGEFPKHIESSAGRAEFLTGLHQQARDRAVAIALEDLWNVVVLSLREYESKELAEVLFAKSSLVDYLALRIALICDHVYFKRERDRFIPRPPAIVDELRKAEAVRREKDLQRERLLAWMQERSSVPALEMPQGAEHFIEILEDTAAGTPHMDNARQRESRELVDMCGERLRIPQRGTREQRAWDILERIHWLKPWTNAAVIRHRPLRRFSDEILRAAHAVIIPATFAELDAQERSVRMDLTSVQSYTIDDPSTLDMDDALSIERLPSGGYRLGVHISDVAGYVEPDSLLDYAARERATSIYLPEETIHMLPPVLAENKLSLVAGEARPCLSCLFEVDELFNVQGSRVTPSLIRVGRKYSYEEIEALLESGAEDFNALYSIAVNCEMGRMEAGALKVYKRDLTIAVSADGRVSLQEFDEHGPARGLVGELMVLANRALAEFARENRIPVIYRTQEPPDESNSADMSHIPPGPAKDYAERARLKKSTTSLIPGLHAGLGLSAYVQATSPIRRYIDLCNQRQINSFLRTGRPHLSHEQLEQVLYSCDEPLALALAVSKESRRYWLLKFLEQRREENRTDGGRIRGTVLRSDLKNPLVELEEVFMPTLAKIPRAVRPGEEVVLAITALDPRRDYIRLEEVSAGH